MSSQSKHSGRRFSSLLALPVLGLAALLPQKAQATASKIFAEAALTSLMEVGLGEAGGYVFPQESVSLDNESLAEIQNMLSETLASLNYSDAYSSYEGVMKAWYSYYRGTSPTAISDAVSTLRNGNSFANYMTEALSKIGGCGYKCASLYTALGQIYVASQFELYNAMKAANVVTANTYDVSSLNAQLNTAQLAANTVLKQLLANKTLFENQFGSTYYHCSSWESASLSEYCSSHWSTREKRRCNYCFTYTSAENGSSQTLCPQSDLSWSGSRYGEGSVEEYKCANESLASGNTCTGDSSCIAQSIRRGTLFRQQIMMAQRDEELGSSFFEAVAALQKIVNKDVAYCGDGICQIGETRYIDGTTTPWCGDCTSSSFARLTSLNQSLPGSNTTLMTSQGYSLKWSTDGDLSIQDSSGNYSWRTSTGGTGATLKLKSDGNLLIANSSGTTKWTSNTTTLNLTINPPTANTLTLIGDVLYLTDSYGNVWWESDTDYNVHAQLSDNLDQLRACWSTSAGTAYTLLMNRRYSLSFQTGLLTLKELATNSVVWSNNSGYTLCNHEDGNLVIYDGYWNKAWSSSVGTGSTSCSSTSSTATGCNFGGYGGTLTLDGNQLRQVSAAGDAMWSSGTCSGDYDFACNTDGATATKAANANTTQCWTGSQTLLSNDYAKLNWNPSTGLTLMDKTPKLAGATSNIQLWSQAPSGMTKVCYTGSGDLAIQDSSGNTLWHANVTAGSLNLIGCNLQLGDATSNYAKWSSKTGCTFGATSNIWGGY